MRSSEGARNHGLRHFFEYTLYWNAILAMWIVSGCRWLFHAVQRHCGIEYVGASDISALANATNINTKIFSEFTNRWLGHHGTVVQFHDNAFTQLFLGATCRLTSTASRCLSFFHSVTDKNSCLFRFPCRHFKIAIIFYRYYRYCRCCWSAASSNAIFNRDDHCSDIDCLTLIHSKSSNRSSVRRRKFHRSFRSFNLANHLVDGDHITDGDIPLKNFSFG